MKEYYKYKNSDIPNKEEFLYNPTYKLLQYDFITKLHGNLIKEQVIFNPYFILEKKALGKFWFSKNEEGTGWDSIHEVEQPLWYK